jgi:hypothetical protein
VAEATEVEVHVIPPSKARRETDDLHGLSEQALAECLRLCLDKAHAAMKEPVAGGKTEDEGVCAHPCSIRGHEMHGTMA